MTTWTLHHDFFEEMVLQSLEETEWAEKDFEK